MCDKGDLRRLLSGSDLQRPRDSFDPMGALQNHEAHDGEAIVQVKPHKAGEKVGAWSHGQRPSNTFWLGCCSGQFCWRRS